MSGYTKLFGSILDSTVWDLPLPTKVTWITLLAMVDRDGVVEASIPGLAKRAGVSLEQCEEALAAFMAPDRYSRSKDHDGRRLEEVRGGWRLLNYEIYREQMTAEDRRERAAARQRRFRERHKVTPSNAEALPVTETDASNDIQKQLQTQKQKKIGSDLLSPRGGRRKVYDPGFDALWKAAGETGDGHSLGNSIKLEAEEAWKKVGRPGIEAAKVWGDYVASLPEFQRSPKHFGRWLKKRCHEQAWAQAPPKPNGSGTAQKSWLERTNDAALAESMRAK